MNDGTDDPSRQGHSRQGHSHRGLLRLAGAAGLLLAGGPLAGGALAGCSADKPGPGQEASNTNNTSSSTASLAGSSLRVFSCPDVAEEQIVEGFRERTGCAVTITPADAEQAQDELERTRSGDLWVTGSAEEAERIGEFAGRGTDLARHVPALAVLETGTRQISGLADLAEVDELLIGDPESTLIGRVAQKALHQAGLWEALQGRTTVTTPAPEIATALATGHGDAGIIWKEETGEGVGVVAESEMAPFTVTVTAVELSCTTDAQALAALVDHLGGDDARGVWSSAGLEPV